MHFLLPEVEMIWTKPEKIIAGCNSRMLRNGCCIHSKKMRVDFQNLSIEVSGDEKSRPSIQILHNDIGAHAHRQDIPLEKVEKAVRMSEETYCGVGALYRKAIEVSSEIKIIEE